MTGFELEILHWFQTLHNGITDPIMVAITTLGNKGVFWIVLSLVLICTKKYRKCGITMVIGLLLSLVFCNGIMKNLVMRDRPFWIDPTLNIIVKYPTDYSFPSGHTSASFAAALALFMWRKKEGIAAIALAALIALSRLYLCVHFPSDVAVSLILGSLYGVISYFVVKWICKKNTKVNDVLSNGAQWKTVFAKK